MSNYYIINKHPVFLTFKNYSTVLCECEKKGILSKEITNSVIYDPQISKQRYTGICKYLHKLSEALPNEFDALKNFSCYEQEAQDNLYNLLESFCDYYNRSGIFSKPYFYLEKSASNFSETKYTMELFMGDIMDIRFPIGKEYYFGFNHKIRKNDSLGVKIYIDTENVESIHGNLEAFIVFLKTGMVIKCTCGEVTIYYD